MCTMIRLKSYEILMKCVHDEINRKFTDCENRLHIFGVGDTLIETFYIYST